MAAEQRRRWTPIVFAIGVAMIGFAWLNHLNPPVLLNDDSIRNQLLARDCTDLGRCHLTGEAASLRGFYQGALWPDLLIAIRLVGGDTTTERSVVLALMAANVATYLASSSAALRANVMALAERGRTSSGLIGGAIITFVCACLGARFRRLSWTARAFLTGVILILPFVSVSLWLLLVEQHHFNPYYVHPVVAPAAVFVAGLFAVPFELGARRIAMLRWLPTVASLALIGRVALHDWSPIVSLPAPGLNSWNLAEAQAITDRIVRRGWNYEDLVFHLQGNACRELLVQMSVDAPGPGPPLSDPRRQLQVMKLPRAALPELADANEVGSLGPTPVAVVRDTDSWLAPESFTACRVPVASPSPTSFAPAKRRRS